MSDAPAILHLSPSETAKALGLTVRALRVYEAKGLVRPFRSRAGWRAYGPDALERLTRETTMREQAPDWARKMQPIIDRRLTEQDKQVDRATGGDPDLTARMGQAWRESFADPDVAPTLPFGPEVMAFVSEAARRALRAAEPGRPGGRDGWRGAW